LVKTRPNDRWKRDVRLIKDELPLDVEGQLLDLGKARTGRGFRQDLGLRVKWKPYPTLKSPEPFGGFA
jgi:hypothetical protein